MKGYPSEAMFWTLTEAIDDLIEFRCESGAQQRGPKACLGE